MSFWDDLSKVFKRGVSVVAKKTDEYTKIGKLKVDIIGIKRDIDKQFNALGANVYRLIVEENNTKVASNEEVKEILDKVKELNGNLDDKKEELEKVREEYAKETGQEIEDVDVEEIKEDDAPHG
ncbi:hypothetical protein H8E88_06745 [candidate division KSB1 bacterium]|nr:hypothetical protein [candidate division KSB1 bacterium]MBL7093402.1 hypothetical protein [candidate division KSB1 bacterium]